MNGAPWGSILFGGATAFWVAAAIALVLAIGVGIGTAITKPAIAERECIVIDMRTHKTSPPPADISGDRT